MSAPLDKAVALAEALGLAQRARMIDQGAAVLLREPARIMACLFPLHPKQWVWPHPTMSPAACLASVRALLREFPNAVGNLALECAEVALEQMLAAEKSAA